MAAMAPEGADFIDERTACGCSALPKELNADDADWRRSIQTLFLICVYLRDLRHLRSDLN